MPKRKIMMSSLDISRRQFLKLLAAIPVSSFSTISRSADLSPSDNKTFLVLLNTLIPQDQYGPSAVEAGLDGLFDQLAARVPNYNLMITEGATWLDRRASRSFAKSFRDLDPSQVNRVLSQAFSEQAGTLPQVFMSRVRQDTMMMYYALPQNWASLGIKGPIQPAGYPDFNRPL
jgi:hypothetical protein